ncbi:MAG: glycosyltransferase family 4 protein [Bacteroidales bacterium]|nr:glycosyltransferase family 4 protein [Bacteroidales bacterium]
MRILLIANYRQGVGGISGQVEILQKKLREEDHSVDVFNTKGSVLSRLMLARRLRKLGGNYDVFHIHCCSNWGFLPAVIGIRVGKRLKKRIVLTYHGGGGEAFFDKHPRLVHRYLTRTDVNIVLSGFLSKVFEKHQLPYVVIPNIIELDSSRFRERNPLCPCFISIRSHESLYNIPCILRAFQHVQQTVPEASLILVGDGSQHEQLVQKAETMDLQHVVFTGRVENKEIYNYLDQADIMLSAPKVDNMPVSLIEAMNAGLLVIASRVGGVPYMIEDGVNGLLFESDNDIELAEKMRWAVGHPVDSDSMTRQAFQSVKKYSWEQIRVSLLSAYNNRN